jgi:hypothetical protein
MQTCWCQMLRMEDAGVVKLYETSPTPCLYVALAANMVGRIPLMPCQCFLDGDVTLTIPHKYSKNKNSCFQAGCAAAAAEDGRSGNTAVNTWLWQFGRGKPRLGGLTIEETLDRQDSASKASDKRLKETKETRDCSKPEGDGA